MKSILLTALSLLLIGGAYAQEDEPGNVGILSEKSSLDGSPRPSFHQHNMDKHWSDFTTIALSPFQFTENGVGVGLSYERAIEPDGIISVYVPVIATFNIRNDQYDPYYGTPYQNNNNVMFYAMPGVKFYPTGMGRVKYAVGPSVVVGAGQKATTSNYYDPYYKAYYNAPGVYDRFLLGMMINNSLNINATAHLYVGAELGFGFTYIDRINTINQGTTFLTQGSFKIGYTF